MATHYKDMDIIIEGEHPECLQCKSPFNRNWDSAKIRDICTECQSYLMLLLEEVDYKSKPDMGFTKPRRPNMSCKFYLPKSKPSNPNDIPYTLRDRCKQCTNRDTNCNYSNSGRRFDNIPSLCLLTQNQLYILIHEQI